MIQIIRAMFQFINDIFVIAFNTPFGDLPFSFGHFFIGVPWIFLMIFSVKRLFGGDDK